MGIISKLKSVLGVADDGQERSPERGRSVGADAEPETTSERAVKGVEGSTSTDHVTTTEEPTVDEPGDPEPEAAEPAGGPEEPVAGRGEPVDSIKGIGAAYAARLADAGVDDVADLAQADPDELAAATDLGTGRVGNWIERARARME